MEKIELEGFFLLGISVRTTNENGQSAKDIGELWERFMGDNVLEQITGRMSDDIYCVYTDYESDHTRPYTAVLGCKVKSLDNAPEGLIGLVVFATSYVKYVAKGRLPDCVAETWQHVWNNTLNRTYIADFDVWGAKAQNPEDAEVEIYVGIA
ncbi:Predicted transcriptional regulator YdeE, contains AraC-type DNA-binding domain [Mucilaginibacter pineti]|uniref:Predicted transcriptional regulator YdeE, contains AraC-type DNA-binding domain n=1 Tax=Mucilaginibacter pineti TaxID=1391627 RepID=A0A1G6XMR1_9SPHI|nr:GyrI-like domain-containing protein [Mucilaginibacter pineti]SDD79450.1 Predicted transcriptional regulator YdeE, contains AraC-type DNA-binding domain [Mucilaginibacter pineti]